MLSYSFVPERDRDIYPEVEMSWMECEDLTIDEHVEKFKNFLRALSFSDPLVERIVVAERNESSG